MWQKSILSINLDFDFASTIFYILVVGTHIPFWYAKWWSDTPLANSYPNLFALSKAKRAFVINMGCWENSVWCWGDFAIQLQQNLSIVQDFLHVFIPAEGTKFFRETLIFSSYSAKNDYDCIMEAKIQDNLEEDHCCAFCTLWKTSVPTRIKAFGYRVFLNRLATKDQLKKMRFMSLDSWMG